MQEFQCPTCERVFETRRGLGVHHSRRHGEQLPNRECAECGEQFYCEYEKTYCSEDCRSKAISFAGEHNPNYSGGKETTTCDSCGTEFEYYPSEKEGVLCSTCVESVSWRELPDIDGPANPRWNGGKVTVSCDVCGTTVERYPSEMDGEVTLCSPACHHEWLSDAFSGDGHPNWRGGDTGNYGQGWNAVRREALERDEFECIHCGIDSDSLGRNPDVHHIIPVRAFVNSDGYEKTDAHTIDNVVSLCPSCHRRAEFGHIEAATLRAEANIVNSD
nr:HNH endonuclease [Halorhabdus sp. SVX81]